MPSAVAVNHAPAVGFLEVARQDCQSLEPWLASLGDTLPAIFPEATSCATLLLRRDPAALVCEHIEAGWGPSMVAAARAAWALAPADMLDDLQRAGTVLRSGVEMGARFPTVAPAMLDLLLPRLGAVDAVGWLAHAGPYTVCLMAAHAHRVKVAHQDSALLTRLSLHVESSLRVKVEPSCVVAVLRPDGRLVHAEREAEPRSTREVLSAHVAHVEKQRGPRRRRDADAIDGWAALCDGHFTLLERASRGTREYLVLSTPPHALARRSLTDLEARALELSARGHNNKMVAYGLGVSESTVSRTLTSAAHRLGLPSGASLVRLAIGVLQPPLASAPLTEAERHIVELLKLGLTNADIAHARRRSVRTVANQIAALLRKTGAASRRALSGL